MPAVHHLYHARDAARRREQPAAPNLGARVQLSSGACRAHHGSHDDHQLNCRFKVLMLCMPDLNILASESAPMARMKGDEQRAAECAMSLRNVGFQGAHPGDQDECNDRCVAGRAHGAPDQQRATVTTG